MDPIDRQALIDVLLRTTTFGNVHELNKFVQKYHLDREHIGGLRDAVFAIVNAPAVQPEPCKSIEDILEYLNDVLFPIVSPGDWNVYSELFNMVSDLTSVQPKVLACGSGELNAQSEQRWIPIEKELPPVNKTVLLSHRSGVTIGWYNGMSYRTNTSARCIRTVKAWMPLPEQYRGEGD